MDFVHTHLHTQFSNYGMLDAISSIDGVINRVYELGQKGFAITDHNGTGGLVEAYVHLEKFNKKHNSNLKLLLGSELYYTNDVTVKENNLYHILFLAKNNKGLENLYHLVSEAHQHFYYKSRCDLDMIRKYSEGLICTSACMGGWLRNPNYVGIAKELKEIFGDDLYLEVHTYQHKDQFKFNQKVMRFANGLNIKTIACCDSHYIKPEDYELHKQIRKAFSKVKEKHKDDLAQSEDKYYQTNDFYIMSVEEVQQKLSYLPKDFVDRSIANTNEIFDKCNVTIEFGQHLYPKFAKDGKAKEMFLDELRKGYKDKILGKVHGKDKKLVDERILHEIDILEKVDYFDYLLITKDIWDNAKRMGVPTGHGRGSISNCECAYLLGLTTLDSITNNLYFERFANPNRISPADVDLDVSQAKRREVIDYIKEKYGYVYQCRTFNYMKARGALTYAGKAMDLPDAYIKNLSKQIVKIDDDDETEAVTDIDEEIALLQSIRTKETSSLIDLAIKFVSIMFSFGKHASCVIISNQDIRKFCSLEYQRDSKTKEIIYVASCNFKYLEKMGLLKEDILGLRTLDVIEECVSYLDNPIDVNHLPWTDDKTEELLCNGDTLGVFQMKSDGMINTLKAMRPKGFLDLITVVALYRPSCIQSGMLNEYLERRAGKQFTYPSKAMQDILGETYGIMVFQEQIMAIVQAVAGYTMAEADTVRRAVGKKDKELMAQITSEFVERAVANGTDKEVAERILSAIVASASYSFSKGHSQSYGYISWITAYLKAHYPLEFYISSINSEHGKQEKILPFISEIKSKGIKLLPPDLRYSENKWTIENGAIRIGLTYIKGIGTIEKPNKDEYTIEHIYQKYNALQLKSLVKSGALDFLGDREHLYYIIDYIKKKYNKKKNAIQRMQYFTEQRKSIENLIAVEGIENYEKKLQHSIDKYNEWKSKYEAEIIPVEHKEGFDIFKGEMDVLGFSNINALDAYDTSLDNGRNVRAVIVTKYKETKTKKGKPMAHVNTLDGSHFVMFEPLVQLKENVGYYLALQNGIIIKTKQLERKCV